MRLPLLAIAIVLSNSPAFAQRGPGYDQGGLFEGLAADHAGTGGPNGADRVGARVGGSGAMQPGARDTGSNASTGVFAAHTRDDWSALGKPKAAPTAPTP